MEYDAMQCPDERGEASPWAEALAQLRQWHPEWADLAGKMAENPWASTVLPRKTIALIGIALNAACTSLNPGGTRYHIRAALRAGASRDEILTVLEMAALLAIHSCSLGAPILRAEADIAGVRPAPRSGAPPSTPACDRLRQLQQWNDAWDPFLELDPVWTNQFMAAGISVYTSATLEPKLIELLSIAFDASHTHMYAPGTRRHIRAALALGATVEEIMEVLKLCVAQGLEACNLGVPILANELADRSMSPGPGSH